MMIKHKRQSRLLAISPSTRGFGFAIFEHRQTLVDWGVKKVNGDKNLQCVKKLRELTIHYKPKIIVMSDLPEAGSRRSERIKELGNDILELALQQKVKLVLISKKRLKNFFFEDANGTKDTIARIVAGRFPEELGSLLPPKRQLWMSESYWMDIFVAVGLALAFMG